MGKEELFKEFTDRMCETLVTKNKNYGDSYSKLRERYEKYFPTILLRLGDKMNRLETLTIENREGTKDESVDDTLLDLAGYCILELVERRLERERRTGDSKNIL